MPKAGAPQLWPICLYSHGTGGDYLSFVNEGIAARLAKAGIATISIDNVLNGERAPAAIRISVSSMFSIRWRRVTTSARAASTTSCSERLAWGLNINGNTFDMKDEMFFGHSQGGLVGPPFLAYEPQVKGAVLSGAGALIYIALLEKTAPVDVTALVGEIDRDYPLDEFDPILAMVQMYMEPADPANYGPLITTTPPAGRTPTNVFQTQGFVDHYAPDDGILAFGVSMGLQPIAPPHRPLDPRGLQAPRLDARQRADHRQHGLGDDGRLPAVHAARRLRRSLRGLRHHGRAGPVGRVPGIADGPWHRDRRHLPAP